MRHKRWPTWVWLAVVSLWLLRQAGQVYPQATSATLYLPLILGAGPTITSSANANRLPPPTLQPTGSATLPSSATPTA